MYKDEESSAILNRAIDLGITYLDTAYAYGDGGARRVSAASWRRAAKMSGSPRKIPDRTRDAFLRRLEASLKRLQTDHVDLVHIHSLGQPDDLAKIEAPTALSKA